LCCSTRNDEGPAELVDKAYVAETTVGNCSTTIFQKPEEKDKCLDLYHSKELDSLVKRVVINPRRTYRQDNPPSAKPK